MHGTTHHCHSEPPIPSQPSTAISCLTYYLCSHPSIFPTTLDAVMTLGIFMCQCYTKHKIVTLVYKIQPNDSSPYFQSLKKILHKFDPLVICYSSDCLQGLILLKNFIQSSSQNMRPPVAAPSWTI